MNWPQFAEGLVRCSLRHYIKWRDGRCASHYSTDTTARVPSIFRKLSTSSDGEMFREIQRHFIRGEEQIKPELVDLARATGLSLVATNGVQYAKPIWA